MTETVNSKQYDLGDRTLRFAQNIIKYTAKLPKTMANIEISRQLIRSSGSVGANYIEANESLSKKDFIMRIKISKKEAKESQYWIKLSDFSDNKAEKDLLEQEALELTKIFGAILEKCK